MQKIYNYCVKYGVHCTTNFFSIITKSTESVHFSAVLIYLSFAGICGTTWWECKSTNLLSHFRITAQSNGKEQQYCKYGMNERSEWEKWESEIHMCPHNSLSHSLNHSLPYLSFDSVLFRLLLHSFISLTKFIYLFLYCVGFEVSSETLPTSAGVVWLVQHNTGQFNVLLSIVQY